MTTIERIGKNIRDKRKAKKITLQQVAGLTGLSIATLSNIESGKQDQKVSHLVKIGKILGEEPGSFFNSRAQ